MPRLGAFPEGSVQTLTTFLRGQLNDKWQAVEAAYDLLGFGLHTSRGIVGRSPVAGVPSDLDACFELESLIRDHQRMKAQTPAQIGAEGENESEEQPSPAPQQRLVGQLNIPPWLTAFALQLLQKLMTT
jgi:hypothetical protein